MNSRRRAAAVCTAGVWRGQSSRAGSGGCHADRWTPAPRTPGQGDTPAVNTQHNMSLGSHILLM